MGKFIISYNTKKGDYRHYLNINILLLIRVRDVIGIIIIWNIIWEIIR